MSNSYTPALHYTKKAEPPRGTILVVEDEIFIRNAFRLYFETMGFKVLVADGGVAALAILRSAEAAFEVVILDLVMPGIHGLELLKIFKTERPDAQVIIATGCGSLSSAVEAMRNGAFDYITKPIVNFDEELLKVVEAALIHRRAQIKEQHHAKARGQSADKPAANAGPNHKLYEKFAIIAHHIGLWRSPSQGNAEEIDKDLKRLEKLLLDAFRITTGLVYERDELEHFTQLHAWGHVGAVDFKADWFSDEHLYHAVIAGLLVAFPTDSVNLARLGFNPIAGVDHPIGLHIPLILEGQHRGALFLFISRNGDAQKHTDLLDLTPSFLMIAPHLASFLLGAIRKTPAALTVL